MTFIASLLENTVFVLTALICVGVIVGTVHSLWSDYGPRKR